MFAIFFFGQHIHAYGLTTFFKQHLEHGGRVGSTCAAFSNWWRAHPVRKQGVFFLLAQKSIFCQVLKQHSINKENVSKSFLCRITSSRWQLLLFSCYLAYKLPCHFFGSHFWRLGGCRGVPSFPTAPGRPRGTSALQVATKR